MVRASLRVCRRREGVAGPDYDPGVLEVRSEIEQQQELDRNWGAHGVRLETRMEAVIDARRAFLGHEEGAVWALRQSLIDLASACELLAGELPVPRIPSTQAAGR